MNGNNSQINHCNFKGYFSHLPVRMAKRHDTDDVMIQRSTSRHSLLPSPTRGGMVLEIIRTLARFNDKCGLR